MGLTISHKKRPPSVSQGAELQGGNLGRLGGGDVAEHEKDRVDRGIDVRAGAQHIDAKVPNAMHKFHHFPPMFSFQAADADRRLGQKEGPLLGSASNESEEYPSPSHPPFRELVCGPQIIAAVQFLAKRRSLEGAGADVVAKRHKTRKFIPRQRRLNEASHRFLKRPDLFAQ
jgi:hypothetical protein